MVEAAYTYDDFSRLNRAAFQSSNIQYNLDEMGNRTTVVGASLPGGVQVLTANTTLISSSPAISIVKLINNSDVTVTLPDASTALGQEFTVKRDITGGRTWQWSNTGLSTSTFTSFGYWGVSSSCGDHYFGVGLVAFNYQIYKLSTNTWLQEASVTIPSTLNSFADIVLSSDGSKLYLAGNDSSGVGHILVYSTTDLSLLNTITLTGYRVGSQLALSQNGSTLYCATTAGVLSINTSTYAFSLLISFTASLIYGMCISPNYVFVSMFTSTEVFNVYNISTGALVTTISAYAYSYLRYDPNGQRVWSVSGTGGGPLIIDAVGLSVTYNKPYNFLFQISYGSGFALDTVNNLAYIGQIDCIQVFDLNSFALITSLKSPKVNAKAGSESSVLALLVISTGSLLTLEYVSTVGTNYYVVAPSATIGDNIVTVSGQSSQLINGNPAVNLVSPTDSVTVIAYQDPVSSAYGWAIQSAIECVKQDANVAMLPKYQQQDFAHQLMVVQLTDSTLVGWGDNTGGALCNGQTAGVSPPSPVLYDPWTPPDPSATVVDWALTSTNLFVVFSDGSVYAGGQNASGQLGDGTTVAKIFLQRVINYLPNNVNRVWASSGAAGTSGMVFYGTSDNKLYACGLNANGQLGLGNTTQWNEVLETWNSGAFTDVVIGQDNGGYWTFLITAAGGLYCTGYNAQGQLGLGNTTQQTSWQPVTIAGAGNIVKVRTTGGFNGTTRYSNTMVLDSNGNIFATGSNAEGQLANGGTTAQTSFGPITTNYFPPVPFFVDFGYGNGQYPTCWALSDVGTFMTWGYGGSDALFTQSTSNQTTAQLIEDLPQVIKAVGPVMNTNVNSPQTIVLCSDGSLKYAGNANGIYGVADQNMPVGVKYIPTIPQMPFPQNEISQWFLHGTGATQRLFVLTKKGKLFALGDNTNAIVTGGLEYSTTNTGGMWYQIDLGRYQR